MELVYLWVEEYKNIKRQGFNFSPRFRCKYENEILTIEDNVDKNDNKNYIENFFDEKGNINITAIVGENGSGKSNLLKSSIDNSIYNEHERVGLYLHNRKWILRYYDSAGRNSLYETNFENMPEQILKISELKKIKNDAISSKTIFYKNILDNDNQSIQFFDIDLSVHSLLKDGTYDYYSKNTQQIIDFLKCKKINLKFSLPDTLYLTSRYFTAKGYLEKILRPRRYDSYRNKLLKLVEGDTSLEFNLYLINHINNYNKENNGMDKFPDLGIESIYNPSGAIEYFKKHISEPEELTNINIIKTTIEESFDKLNDHKLECEISKIPDSFIQAYSSIDPDNKLYDFEYGKIKLSSGQYHFVLLFSRIFHELEQFRANKNWIIYIDEGEITLHPNWQKQYITQLSSFFKENYYDHKIHLIFTTHSPFLLSDLPKENVIFLDTYDKEKTKEKYSLSNTDGLKDGDCINVSKHIDINPFGANIHTLLSDGFFMEDGLMGEFAKGKIQEIIEFFNGKNELYKDNERKLKQIIESIGEAFLKDKLLKMYDKKYPKSNEEKIIELQKQIDELNNG